MKKKKKKLKKRRILLLLLLIVLIINLFNHSTTFYNIIISFQNNSNYKTIKENTNKKYSGIGQKKINNESGYFTTFTTEEKHKKIYKEYKQNGVAPWSNSEYWGGTMTDNGCGITAISIILSGYGQNYTPEDLRAKYYPVLDNSKISKELSSTFGIKNTDFYYDSVHLSKESLMDHLLSNRPVLICVWNKPNDNRWTTTSHYMVLLATDGDDMVYISNPNGGKNDSKSSGWYEFKEITPYIAKALFIESY